MKLAICDSEAIYPFRDLVEGRIRGRSDLLAVERFIRTVVLHDEINLQLTPMAFCPEADSEGKDDYQVIGGKRVRLVIVGIGPAIGYDFLKTGKITLPDSTFDLSPAIRETISEFSNAAEGNAFYKAHIEYAQRAFTIVSSGQGSALLCSEFGQEIIGTAERYPATLFAPLDKEWKEFAKTIGSERLGFSVPPVLAIVLSRCARRDAIPVVVKDLRDEWGDARRKVWKLIDSLRTCRTIGEAREINCELTEASLLFAPVRQEFETRPGRMLWDIGAAGISGAIISYFAGGNPIIGGAITGASQIPKTTAPLLHEFGKVLFRTGAFDLANKVRRETSRIEIEALQRLLDADELKSLE